MSHDHKHNGDIKPPEYQDRDILLKPLWMFFLVTIISVGGCFWILRVLQRDLEVRITDSEKPSSPLTAERQLPPETMPRLQVRPVLELQVMRAHEDALINGGVQWADSAKTKARIPITNAMQLILSKPGAFPTVAK